MAAFREGRVVAISETSERLVRAQVDMGGHQIEVVGFPAMLGPIATGDRVVVNTTGLELALGTGGVGFLLWDLDGPGSIEPGPGHILKMRYTPWQTEVAAVEAPDSPHHSALERVTSIEGMPVVACSLHSQTAGVAAGIKQRVPDAKVAYVMTDGGALPLAWSDLVRSLQAKGLIDLTCSAGHSFGGDLEAVNVFSALAAVRTVGGADVAVVAMGPGLAGSGTALGFTGIEQGQVLDAASALGGQAVACLRISFHDDRSRHQGISHHTITALTIGCRERARVVLPDLTADRSQVLRSQLAEQGIEDRHDIVVADGQPGVRSLEAMGLEVTSMGRSFHDAPEGALAAAAAGAVAADALDNPR